jgi:quinol-cytochrome oxidoreductase complex cytochrome b subunit
MFFDPDERIKEHESLYGPKKTEEPEPPPENDGMWFWFCVGILLSAYCIYKMITNVP